MHLPLAHTSSPVLTDRDTALLVTLGHKLPLMSMAQVKRCWWSTSGTSVACQRRLRTLESYGLVRRRLCVAAAPAVLEVPLACWQPGQPPPEFALVVNSARRRGASPTSGQVVYTVTNDGAARTGGRTPTVRPSDIAHDLLLGEVFLALQRQSPELLSFWRLPCPATQGGDRVADAVLARPGRSVYVEVVGSSYSTTKLRLVHRHCEARGLEYQLW